MKVNVLDMDGKKLREMELPAAIFEAPINIDLMHQAYVRQMANARLGTPGSRGSGTTPGRVLKGARSAGHMGTDRVTTQALKIVMVDVERNLLGVHGAVPGGKGGLVLIKEARKQ